MPARRAALSLAALAALIVTPIVASAQEEVQNLCEAYAPAAPPERVAALAEVEGYEFCACVAAVAAQRDASMVASGYELLLTEGREDGGDTVSAAEAMDEESGMTERSAALRAQALEAMALAERTVLAAARDNEACPA